MTSLCGVRPIGRSLILAAVLAVALGSSSAWADQPAPIGERSGAADGKDLSTARPTAGRLLCVHGVETGQGLQVRAEAGADKLVIGNLPADQCGISLVGKCSGDWCEMALGEVRGWVDTRFVGVYEIPDLAKARRPKAVVAAPATRPQRKAPAPASPPRPVAQKAIATTTDRDDRRAHSGPRRQMADRSPDIGRFAPTHYSRLYFGACVSRVAWWDTLRIRSGPGTGHNEIGSIPPGACRVETAGACRGAWCRVAWRGRIGWVNTYYLE